jgi:maltooligosyltrehalose synthase
MFLIHRALELRARRPEAFAGGYTPVAAGERCCAYLRGGTTATTAEPAATPAAAPPSLPAVLAATGIRPGSEGSELELPASAAGRWRDVLSGTEHDLHGRVPLDRIAFRDWRVALLERLDH